MSLKEKAIKVFLPVIIVLIGAAVMLALIKSRKAPDKVHKPDRGALVEVMEVSTEDHTVTVSATGTVTPARRIELMPEVSGTVSYVTDTFESGGFFKKGALLFRIQDTDYRLRLQQAQAALAKAEYDLAVTRGRAGVAKKEWALQEHAQGVEPNPLALYVPQLKNALASVKAAGASVQEARVRLGRTQLRAPFDLRVSTESVEIGRYVSSGKPVAVLSGTGRAEVMASLTLGELGWINVPGPGKGKGGEGSSASVFLDIGDSRLERTGRVDRSVGELDLKNRMMQVVITVDDPYSLKKGSAGRPALPSGAFVEIEIEGVTVKGVSVIPRKALREGSTVWVLGPESKLRIKKVSVLRVEREEAVIRGGLSDGDMVVLTTLSGAADGMKLRTGRLLKKEIISE